MSRPWRVGSGSRPPFSYRADTSVPPFPDENPLLVFDGTCVFCSGFAQFFARHDTAGHIRFTACQSPLGGALMRHYGVDPDTAETSLLVTNGQAFGKLDGFAETMRLLPSPWPAFAIVAQLPASLGDWLYDLVARNRYRLLGRREACIVPDASWRARVLE